MLGFVIAFISYSFWQPLEKILEFQENNKGSIFFLGIAFAFCCYTSAYMFEKWNKWRWFPMFVVMICISRFTVECYILADDNANPEKYDIFDYISFLISVFIAFNYYIKHRMKNANS
jgi:hypothetical protein